MGSFAVLSIPVDFRMLDLDRVASSCTVLTGFSDEITCSFIQADQNGYQIKISGGFDSKDSDGDNLSFLL
jgi:hypothetical protein